MRYREIFPSHTLHHAADAQFPFQENNSPMANGPIIQCKDGYELNRKVASAPVLPHGCFGICKTYPPPPKKKKNELEPEDVL